MIAVAIRSRLSAALFAVLVYPLIAGCGSAPKRFETYGAAAGDQFFPLEIIGISNKATGSMNRRNAESPFIETVELSIPVGTELIVPTVRGWKLAYGAFEPDTVDVHTGQAPGAWQKADRPYGIGVVNIHVLGINPPDFSVTPARQTATIEIELLLANYHADDRWSGLVNYTLIYLGRKKASPGE